MKIHHIKVRDFLGVQSVELDPGSLTVFAGRNGQAKSSMLKAIRAAFEGCPSVSVRQGAEKSEVVIDAGDLTIRRVATEKNPAGAVTVKDSEGRTLPRPQALLTALCGGALRFNPIEFVREPKRQRQRVLEALPLELPAGEDAREGEHALDYCARRVKEITETRRLVGADGKKAKADVDRLAAALKELGEVPADCPSVGDAEDSERTARDALTRAETQAEAWAEGQAQRKRLVAEKTAQTERLGLLEKYAKSVDEAETKWAKAVNELDDMESSIVTQRTKVANLRGNLDDARDDARDIAGRRERLTEIAKQLEAEPEKPDTDKPSEAHREARVVLEAAKKAGTHRDAAEALDGAKATKKAFEKKWADETTELDFYRKEFPQALVSECAEDLGDIGVTDDGVTFKGRPLANLGEAEQIRVALSIVQRMSGDLRVVCIDGVESFDDEQRAALYSALEDEGLQAFVTRVGSPGDGEIEMRDGELFDPVS